MTYERSDDSRTADSGSIEALLRPTIAGSASSVALYSVRASFFVAFFGGVFAALIFSGLNARRLGRLRGDLWLYGGVAFVWTIVCGWYGYAATNESLPVWIGTEQDGARNLRLVTRAVAIGAFGLTYLRLRPFFKAAQIAGQEPPNPWTPALTVIAIGTVLQIAVVAAGGIWPW